MKKVLIIFCFLISFTLYSQDAENSGPEKLSFKTTLKNLNLSNRAELNSFIDKGTWVILDGSLSSITRISSKDEEYLIEALLVQGEWQELEEVKKYECRLIFQGNQWQDIVPDRVPRNVKEGMILLNSHVMVLGNIVSYETVENKIVPYLMVKQIREIP